ncbi:MAG: hypothetical protein JWL60_851 [Gemmatimonadetes bacterium]|nr:hypothetical protein [Gemmatimonadota bacterium]
MRRSRRDAARAAAAACSTRAAKGRKAGRDSGSILFRAVAVAVIAGRRGLGGLMPALVSHVGASTGSGTISSGVRVQKGTGDCNGSSGTGGTGGTGGPPAPQTRPAWAA